MSSWKKGKKLNNGQYIIESILLRSGYGLFYRAKETKTDQLVTIKATKIFWQQQENAQQLEKQFIQQATQIANKCQSPYLVKLYPQVFLEREHVYMVMDYPEGIDLATYIDHYGKLPTNDALNIITKVASALNILHQNKTLHQDIRPQNIIIDSNSQNPLLIDYGIGIKLFAVAGGKKSSTANDCFTPPEKLQDNSKLSIGSDIYSLAATFYVLVTGQLPFSANLRNYQDLPTPKQLNSSLSDRLSEGIMQGMELNPKQRPQHLKDWLDLFKGEEQEQQELVASNISEQPKKNLDILKGIVINNNQTLVQKPTNNIAPPTITKRKQSYPNIEKFTFETVKIELQKKFFGLRSEYKKNLITTEGQFFVEYLGEGVNLEMVFIPAGTFMMGGNKDEKNENPLHSVHLKSFYISKYPITQLQWRVISDFPKTGRYLKHKPSFFKGDNLPVERISWFDTQEFCKRLSKYTGRNYRLPTESEWEYACRAKTDTSFFFGDHITPELANYDEENKNDPKRKSKKTTPVDNFYPNPFGLYDCHGNVCEWCEDHYTNSYTNKPKDGSAYYSPKSKPERVARGGCWSVSSTNCRSGKRNGYIADSSYNFIGFRIVCVLD